MSFSNISVEHLQKADEFFKSERTAWQIKTITDKNGKQRKVRIAPAKPEKPAVLHKKTEDLDDASLIKDAVSGKESVSQKAKAQLYEKYHKDAYKIIYTFLQSNEKIPEVKELTEDLVTDSFVKIYNNLEGYSSNLQNSLSFKAWFTRIASNTARDYLRSLDLKIKQNAASDTEMKTHFNSATGDSTPYEDLVLEEQTKAIHSAINSLPKEYSEPIKLFYFEDKSFAEIAKMLNTTSTAISSRIQYARKMLKNKLSPEMFKALTLYFDSKDILNK